MQGIQFQRTCKIRTLTLGGDDMSHQEVVSLKGSEIMEELKVVDYGRFIYLIPKGTLVVIILDKKEDDVDVELKSLVEYYGDKVVGSTYMENYFIRGMLLEEKYSTMEKWWNLFGEKLLFKGCKHEAEDYFYPSYETSDFTKEELRMIAEWTERNSSAIRDLLESNDIMMAKELLRKDLSKVLRLNKSLRWYLKAVEDGRLSKRALMTLREEIIDRDIQFILQQKKAERYDSLGFKIPYEFYQKVGDYIIRAPNTFMEIVMEGKYMGNCIGGYVSDIVSEDTRVFFMRKIGDLSTPLVDIEVNKDDELCQALMRFNQYPTDELLGLIEKWRRDNSFELDVFFNDFGEFEDDLDELLPDFQEEYAEYLG